MSDNCKQPRNRVRKRRDLICSEADRLVSELIPAFGKLREGGTFLLNADTQKAIKECRDQLRFYQTRCENIQAVFRDFRDPERQIVAEILANGYSMKAGQR